MLYASITQGQHCANSLFVSLGQHPGWASHIPCSPPRAPSNQPKVHIISNLCAAFPAQVPMSLPGMRSCTVINKIKTALRPKDMMAQQKVRDAEGLSGHHTWLSSPGLLAASQSAVL